MQIISVYDNQLSRFEISRVILSFQIPAVLPLSWKSLIDVIQFKVFRTEL